MVLYKYTKKSSMLEYLCKTTYYVYSIFALNRQEYDHIKPRAILAASSLKCPPSFHSSIVCEDEIWFKSNSC